MTITLNVQLKVALCLASITGAGLMHPAQAMNVQQMKQRIKKSTSRPGEHLRKKAEQLACKTDKKPVCYANAHVKENRFALVKIRRPKQGDLALFFEYTASKQWALRSASKFKELKIATLIHRAPISQKTAKKLIAKLHAQ